MEFEVVPYKKESFASFTYDGVEQELSGASILPIVDYYSTMGSVFVGKVGDKVIGVGGVYNLWPLAGGCFLFLNRQAQDYKKSVFKALLEYTNMLIKKYEIKTLMVECLDNSIQAKSLIEHLGFIKNREVKLAFYTRQEKI